MIRIRFSRVLNRIDDDIHVVHHERSTWCNWVISIEPRLACAVSQGNAEMLSVPIARRNRIFAEQVQVTEAMMVGGVQFDKAVVWSFDVRVKETTGARAAENIADVCQRGEELRTRLQLFLILRFHVFRTPPEVPNRGSEFPGWRRLHLVEEKPRLLRPHRILIEKLTLFAIELACVELDCTWRVSCIEMQVMKMCGGFQVLVHLADQVSAQPQCSLRLLRFLSQLT